MTLTANHPDQTRPRPTHPKPKTEGPRVRDDHGGAAEAPHRTAAAGDAANRVPGTGPASNESAGQTPDRRPATQVGAR
jgi:hypothetical protein